MIGWLLVLSFLLGLTLTWLYMVRTVRRTVEPVSARRRDVGTDVDGEPSSDSERIPRVRRAVEFDDETEGAYER